MPGGVANPYAHNEHGPNPTPISTTVPSTALGGAPAPNCGAGYVWSGWQCVPASIPSVTGIGLPTGTGNVVLPTGTGNPPSSVVSTSIWSSPDAEYILIGAAVVLFLVLMVVFLRK